MFLYKNVLHVDGVWGLQKETTSRLHQDPPLARLHRHPHHCRIRGFLTDHAASGRQMPGFLMVWVPGWL